MQNFQSASMSTNFQRSMHLSSTQLQRLFDSLISVVFAIDLDGNFVYVSKSSFTISGYLPEELIGRSYLDLVSEDDKNKTEDYFRKQIYGQDTSEFENCLVKKDGSIIHISWNGRWDAKDKMYYCVVSDITERKFAEVQREQYHKNIGNIMERITDGFFSVDKDWTITYRNHQTELLTGKKNHQVHGKNLWNSYPELIGTIVFEQLHKTMEEKVSVQFEYYYNQMNSWFAFNVYPTEDGLSVFFKNINERKQAEVLQLSYDETIKERNTYMKAVIDGFSEGFVSLDEDQKVMQWNKKAESIFGVRYNSVFQKSFHSCFNTIEGLAFYQEFEKLINQNKEGSFNIYFRESNKWFETTLVSIQKNVFIFIKDVTSQRKTKEELRKLSAMAKKTVATVLLTDPEGRITSSNDALTTTTGYTTEEATGKTLGELLCATEANYATSLYIHDQINKGKSFQIEILSHKKSKEAYWIEVEGQPVKEGNGNIIQFFTIITDISKRKRLQQEVKINDIQEQQQTITSAVIKAQERERELISKELNSNVNQVLTTVKLYTELCLTGAGNKEKILRKSLNLLQSSILEINSLSRRLSPSSTGNVSLKDTLNELVESVSSINKMSIHLDFKRMNNFEVNEELHLAVYRILQEHLMNISNHANAQNVHILINGTSNELNVKVKDDGVGFDTRKKTNGIGLTSMATRAQTLKGNLTINSAPGSGCELYVRFPLN